MLPLCVSWWIFCCAFFAEIIGVPLGRIYSVTFWAWWWAALYGRKPPKGPKAISMTSTVSWIFSCSFLGAWEGNKELSAGTGDSDGFCKVMQCVVKTVLFLLEPLSGQLSRPSMTYKYLEFWPLISSAGRGRSTSNCLHWSKGGVAEGASAFLIGVLQIEHDRTTFWQTWYPENPGELVPLNLEDLEEKMKWVDSQVAWWGLVRMGGPSCQILQRGEHVGWATLTCWWAYERSRLWYAIARIVYTVLCKIIVFLQWNCLNMSPLLASDNNKFILRPAFCLVKCTKFENYCIPCRVFDAIITCRTRMLKAVDKQTYQK